MSIKLPFRLLVLIAALILLSCAVLVGCGVSIQKETEAVNTEEYTIYYKSADGSGLRTVQEEIAPESTEDAIGQLIGLMQYQIPDEPDLAPAVADSLTIENVDTSLLPYVVVNFGSSYMEMNKADEILCRAALVLTLTQVPNINYVEIQVDGSKLTDANDIPIGAQNAQNFVTDDNQLLAKQKTEVILYFINHKGTKLVPEEQTVLNEEEVPEEKTVIKQLLSGPSDPSLQPLFSDGVEVLNISVKNSTCYVNFNEAFLQVPADLNPELVIYGIVNSLAELNTVNSVQILVDGSSDVKYANDISLTEPFSRSGKYVQTTD